MSIQHRLALVLAFAVFPWPGIAEAQDLEIRRAARGWEFMDAVGPHAAVLGKESGRFEAWVYPLKILRDFHLEFKLGGRLMPGESVARSVAYRPESTTLIYSGDYYAQHFRVRQRFVAPRDERGILIRLLIESSAPLEIDASFRPDFQLMWPAGLESSFSGWDETVNAFQMGAEGRSFRAFAGSPQGRLKARDFATNYNSSERASFSLGTFEGAAEASVAIAASFQGREEAVAAYRRLLENPARLERETADFYQAYLRDIVRLELPDAQLERAYQWSMISMVKGLVENPFMEGRGLAAGFGLSKGAPRPGFAWFFGRDTFWTTLALTAAGDFQTARQAIEFIAAFQREDGKIPHEISQSAPFVPWFEDYPYPWAAADATPLFIIAAHDYLRASDDRRFLDRQWERLAKALDFMKSTYDEDGFAKNQGVGHGWIEGGPLLPVRTEFYQASMGVAALRSMAELARMRGDSELAASLEQEFEERREALDEHFWLEEKGRYALAVDLRGHLVDEPSVLACVPMWFGLLDRQRSRRMISRLADQEHLSDWGSRIISSDSANYGPAGYHFGSVWPLFSGWASQGQYESRAPGPGLANLMANARLALDGSGGHTTEVVSGAVYSPLSTSSPHQIWSAAMVVSPLLRGLLGLEADALDRQLRLSPQPPGDWNRFAVRNLPLGGEPIDIFFTREEKRWRLRIEDPHPEPLEVNYRPHWAPSALLGAVRVNGQTAGNEFGGEQPGPAHLMLTLDEKENLIEIPLRNDFRYSFETELPVFGMPSSNLKLLREEWSPEARTVTLHVSGLGGRSYRIRLHGGASVETAAGAALSEDKRTLTVDIPASQPPGYRQHQIELELAQPQE